MRFKFTGLLLVVAVVALAYFFLVEQPRHRRAVDDRQQEQRLTTLLFDDVDSLNVERSDVTLDFVRVGDRWRMRRPTDDLADRGVVNTLLTTIVNTRIERRLAGGSLAEYGLDPPAALILAGTDSGRLKISVGDLSVTKSHCYVRRGDDSEVLLVPAGLRRYALRSLFEWRDKKVLEFPADDVSHITIKSAGATFDWQRTPSKNWFSYIGNDTIRGDSRALRMVLGELRAMRATDIMDNTADNHSRYITPPSGTIAIRLPGDSTEIFLFSKRTDDSCYVALQDGSRIVRMGADVLDVFERSLDDLRDRNVLHFDRGEIARITVETETWTGSIHNTGEEWSFANPEMGAIDQKRVSAFLLLLEELKFSRIVEERIASGAGYGLDQPTARLTLYNEEGRVVDQATTGMTLEQGNVRYAMSVSSRLLGTIDAEPLIDIQARFEGFRIK